MKTWLAAFVMCLAFAFAAQPAFAEKGGWHYYDPDCPIAVGPISVKFLAMQPKKTTDRNCDELTDKGAAVLVFDAHESDARELLWDIRVVRDTGGPDGTEDLAHDTVLHEPAQKYPNGMVSLDHYFKEGGNYLVLVSMKSEDGARSYVGRHRITVGVFDVVEAIAYTLFGVVAVGIVGFLARPYWQKKAAG